MKLTPTRIEHTLTQFDARVVPDSHPVMSRFTELFGDHTFFINGDGLAIVEPMSSKSEDGKAGQKVGQVVKLARWLDENHTSLAPHEREATQVVVLLDKAA
ncbi:hypothetical protein [Terrarubrum flagellatum]|uniref:hypothetical protein n=1 Tax=Terrirubrum flagellatum TaxID=2895980 RepID=UPI003145224B